MATVSFLKSVYTQVSVIMICKATLYKKKRKKKLRFHLFVTIAAFSWCLTTTLHSNLLSTPPQKAMKWNGGDSHILAGASQTLLVNTRRMEQD